MSSRFFIPLCLKDLFIPPFYRLYSGPLREGPRLRWLLWKARFWIIVAGGCGWLLWVDQVNNLNSSVGANYMKKCWNVLKYNRLLQRVAQQTLTFRHLCSVLNCWNFISHLQLYFLRSLLKHFKMKWNFFFGRPLNFRAMFLESSALKTFWGQVSHFVWKYYWE